MITFRWMTRHLPLYLMLKSNLFKQNWKQSSDENITKERVIQSAVHLDTRTVLEEGRWKKFLLPSLISQTFLCENILLLFVSVSLHIICRLDPISGDIVKHSSVENKDKTSTTLLNVFP